MGPKKNPIAARIKKLMQADEEVGKIAQATPVLMGTLSITLPTLTLLSDFHASFPFIMFSESARDVHGGTHEIDHRYCQRTWS